MALTTVKPYSYNFCYNCTLVKVALYPCIFTSSCGMVKLFYSYFINGKLSTKN